MSLKSARRPSAGAVLVFGICLSMLATPVHARPAFGANCAGCHGNPVLGSTPGNGGTLDFGSTLVGQSRGGQYTLRNTSNTAPLGGGFKGSFPDAPAGGPFALLGNATIAGDAARAPGYLTPQLGSESRTYQYTPTARGTNSTTLSFTPTAGYNVPPPTITVKLQGKGVAPVAELSQANADAGQVRIGTSSTASLAIRNAGDGNASGVGDASNLKGGFGASAGVFSGTGGGFNLADGASASRAYQFTPVGRGLVTQNVQVQLANGHTDGTNQAQNLSATLQGVGVGPSFAASIAPGQVIDLGPVFQPAQSALILSNDTPDDDFGNATALTLLSFEITGDYAPFFSLDGFVALKRLDKGESTGLTVGFVPGADKGLHTATLTIFTDQGAALRGAGQSFQFALQAEVIPEPQTWALLSLGIGSVVLVVRRRRALRLP